jgi:hypothetical protein
MLTPIREPPQPNFYEKALFVKPTWRPRSRPAQ